MTDSNLPSGTGNADGLDVDAALKRAHGIGLVLDDAIRPGVETNLALLAEHYRAVLSGLAESGTAQT